MRIVLCLLIALLALIVLIAVMALLAGDAGESLQLFHALARPSILAGAVASAAGTVKRVPLTAVSPVREHGNGEHA
ncbi:hypothetical protein [Streptomyces sp. NBC_01451]|uniref:hypothetical protein n=1 Tax=Streptomyces sp. NBC_01451 TaxID=2903872 RepID=UPI002E31001E|nr:hypothetical protein [Streptomyces sp. NBC_01451]